MLQQSTHWCRILRVMASSDTYIPTSTPFLPTQSHPSTRAQTQRALMFALGLTVNNRSIALPSSNAHPLVISSLYSTPLK